MCLYDVSHGIFNCPITVPAAFLINFVGAEAGRMNLHFPNLHYLICDNPRRLWFENSIIMYGHMV